MINQVILVGNLGRDPEIRATQAGDKIANLSLATTERWKDKTSGEQKEKTEWHRIVVFGKLAGVVETYAQKGSTLYVQGKLQTRKFQQDGVDKYSTEVVIDFGGQIRIMKGGTEKNGAARTAGPAPAGRSAVDDLDDEIPF